MAYLDARDSNFARARALADQMQFAEPAGAARIANEFADAAEALHANAPEALRANAPGGFGAPGGFEEWPGEGDLHTRKSRAMHALGAMLEYINDEEDSGALVRALGAHVRRLTAQVQQLQRIVVEQAAAQRGSTRLLHESVQQLSASADERIALLERQLRALATRRAPPPPYAESVSDAAVSREQHAPLDGDTPRDAPLDCVTPRDTPRDAPLDAPLDATHGDVPAAATVFL